MLNFSHGYKMDYLFLCVLKFLTLFQSLKNMDIEYYVIFPQRRVTLFIFVRQMIQGKDHLDLIND